MSKGNEQGKLFVGGLSWDTTKETLTEHFTRYGEVVDCIVMKNPQTGKSRGFGFVTYKDPACVETVLSSGPHELDGRQVDPKACNPKAAQQNRVRSSDGNSRGGGGGGGDKSRKIFVGGLPNSAGEDTLKSAFGRYGNVTEVVIMYDQQRKRSRGFGFLTFESEESVDEVCKARYVDVDGKQVECKRAEPRDGKQGGGGGGGGGPWGGPPGGQWNQNSGPPGGGMGYQQDFQQGGGFNQGGFQGGWGQQQNQGGWMQAPMSQGPPQMGGFGNQPPQGGFQGPPQGGPPAQGNFNQWGGPPQQQQPQPQPQSPGPNPGNYGYGQPQGGGPGGYGSPPQAQAPQQPPQSGPQPQMGFGDQYGQQAPPQNQNMPPSGGPGFGQSFGSQAPHGSQMPPRHEPYAQQQPHPGYGGGPQQGAAPPTDPNANNPGYNYGNQYGNMGSYNQDQSNYGPTRAGGQGGGYGAPQANGTAVPNSYNQQGGFYQAPQQPQQPQGGYPADATSGYSNMAGGQPNPSYGQGDAGGQGNYGSPPQNYGQNRGPQGAGPAGGYHPYRRT